MVTEMNKMYLQIAMMDSPLSYNGNDEDIKRYKALSSQQPEKVLSIWREMKIYSDVISYYQGDNKFEVEEDNDGIYLMVRIDDENDIPKYQNGDW